MSEAGGTAELQGKVALVTGGSRGIGRAICDALAAGGARVAVVARDAARAQAAAQELPGGNHAGFGCDVADEAAVEATIKSIEEQLGPIEIVVNNAGIAQDNLLVRLSSDDWDRAWTPPA